jgi:hypothetical protein
MSAAFLGPESHPRDSISELVLFRACLVCGVSSGTSSVRTIGGDDSGATLPAFSPVRKTEVSSLKSTSNEGRSNVGRLGRDGRVVTLWRWGLLRARLGAGFSRVESDSKSGLE